MPEAPTQATAPAPQAQTPDTPLPTPTALKGREDRSQDVRSTGDVLKDLANDRSIGPREATSALEWFLAEDTDEQVGETQTIELNVGVAEERWITWTVRPVDADEMRRIQRQSASLRRRSNQDDLAVDMLANLRVVVAASVDPDITSLAERAGKDPIVLLRDKFSQKPGLVSQLATKIMGLSGFDDEDVRDAISAKN